MPYSHKVRATYLASLEASTAYDTAWAGLDKETIPDTEDYGSCMLCGAPMYYCMDYTHAEDCPIADVGKMHDLLQDALMVLDDAMAKKLIAAGRESELRQNPLESIGRAELERVNKE